MGIVELGAKMKKAVMSKPTLEDLDAAIVKAEAAALEAAKASQRARDAFTVDWEKLANEGDELGIRRLREEISTAERLQQHAEEDVRLHHGRREKVRAAHAQTLHDEAITEFERTSQLLYVRDQTIVDLVHKLANEIEARGLISMDLQRLVDTLLVRQRTAALSRANTPAQTEAARKLRTAVSANEYPALFDNATVLHLIALEIYIRTHGKWPHRNIGLDLYSLSQGPKFDDRSRDYLRLLQRNLIELGIVPQPPPRAA